jgi:hypothetical protein
MTEPHEHPHGIQQGEDHSSGDGHGLDAGGHSSAQLIGEEEFRHWERSDLGAGKVVVSLMAGIFTVGLLLYATILVIVLT